MALQSKWRRITKAWPVALVTVAVMLTLIWAGLLVWLPLRLFRLI